MAKEAPELLPKRRSRSVPVVGPIRKTEPRAGRSRLTLNKRGPLIPLGDRGAVRVVAPGFWDTVMDLRDAIKERNLVEGSAEEESGHAESAIVAGNR